MNINTTPSKRLRTIKSFVLRKGRTPTKDSCYLQKLWAAYGICCNSGEILDLAVVFQREAPIVLEIGFGNGQTLLHMAQQNPSMNFIGIEVYQSGIAQLLTEINKCSLSNIRVCQGDAVEILRNNIPTASLNILQLFFPDPWPKARHHKRRVVQAEFIDLLHDKLSVSGVFHVATDWENYAIHILGVMASRQDFIKLDGASSSSQTLERITSKFEQRGKQLGHDIYDFAFKRI